MNLVGVPDVISDWRQVNEQRRYARLALVAFVAFFGTFGMIGGATVGTATSPIVAILIAFFAACTMMASVVYVSSKKMGLWQGVLPKEFERIMEGTDQDQPEPKFTDPEKRAILG